MATSASTPINPYELLGVSPDARDEAINKAFRQKSLKVHPDRNPDNPEAGKFDLYGHLHRCFLQDAV